MKTKLILSLLLGSACLWLAFRGVHWHEVARSLRGLNVFYILLMFPLMAATHLFRARRWGVLLRPLKRLPFKELFAVNAVGFLAIHLFPFRLGEFTRPLLLRRRQKLPMSTGLAMVAVERVFDGLIATLALFIGIMTVPAGHDEMPLLAMGLHTMALGALALFLPLLGFLILAVVERDRAMMLICFCLKLFPRHLRERLSGAAENFFEGLKCLPDIFGLLRLFIESVAVWGAVALAYWLAIQAFHFDLSWGAAFSVLGIGAIGVMLPGPPGFVGTFQLFVQASLVLYGVSKSAGLAYSIVVYAVNMTYVVAAGLIFLPAVATPVRALYSEAASEKLPSS